MPLLNKKNFVINDPPPNLRDDEEVFYSELTNEIFRDYEEFCERIFLCNSLVWSCSYTGRSSLTYQEAVNSELLAKKTLNEFPLKLRIPVLYLTTLTERSSLLEFAEDVFAFARDRYFIGEDVEVNFTNDTWTDCRIVKVQYPTQKRLQEHNQQNQKTKSGERDYWPPAGLYSYEVEVVGEGEGGRQVVAADKVRRRKGVYTREKNRLYIKQFVERQDSVWKLKKSVYLKYGIDKVKFDMIFCGPAMVSLAPSKKKPAIKKPVKDPTKKENEKKKVQGSIEKYFSKEKTGQKQENGDKSNNPKKPTPKKPGETPQKTLVQKLKNKYKMNAKNGKVLKTAKGIKTEKTEKLPRGRKKKEVPEKKALTRDELQKLAVECKDKDVKEKIAFLKKNNLTKEEKVQVLELVKEYTKFREDLECIMLKELPAPLPIQMRIPNELFGDFLHMLEFFNSFSNVVNVRDFISGGITFELLERALVEKEVAGPLSDVIHVLLVTLFELQDQEEDYDDKLSLDSGSEPQNEKLDPLINFRLAVAAATYSQQYHGHPLSQLTLDSASLTEVLRLHIISSGRRLIDDSDPRGPTMNVEDPCTELCLRHPNLLNVLSQKSVFELPIEDKVLIINSLINQILSFGSIKESIEEEIENLKVARVELRSKRAAEVKRIKEAEKELKEQQKAATGENKDKEKSKDNKDKEKAESMEVDGGVDGEAAPKTRLRLDKNLVLKARELAQLELRVQCLPLGTDRAYRRYWLFYSTPGLYVEDNEPFPGTCVPRDVIDNLSPDSPLKYVRRLFDDKENLAGGGKASGGGGRPSLSSPSKKLLAEKNGDAATTLTPSLATGGIKVEDDHPDKLGLVCTGDVALCPIHGTATRASCWSFYKDEADLNALIDSLSKYGVRESHLRKELIKNKQRILDSVKRCPHSKLNPSVPEDPEQLEIKKSSKSGPKYLNPHLDFPPDTPIDEILISSLRYMILETEDKIYAGHIGTLKVKDRAAWREALNEKSYDKQCDELSWGPKKEKNLTEIPSNESNEDNKEVTNSISQSSATSDNIERLMRTDVESPKKEVFDLACAILQIEQAIEHRFLKKPFGIADCKEKDKEKAENEGYRLRERWELSLMASCSISQLFVHIYSLDNHIAWSRSALKALCRICRRASNPESMLLCDMCNKGHHMSCLKPPLKKVPEGDWFCPTCCPKPSPVKRSRKEKMDVDESDTEACKMLGRCKQCKDEGELVVCDSCESGWHLECIIPPLRKQPRSKWTCSRCRHNAKRGSSALEDDERGEKDDPNRRRSSRRESAAAAAAEANSCSALRSDLPLDNAALQEMLDALMHHKDAWPFLRPVTKAEVPDYRTIIKKPMDFGTIKHKLNMLEYSKNSQVIADALLVFDNCYTYNQPDSEVFKAGERLQKMFEKLCSDRKMNIDVDYEVRPPSHKKPKLM